MTMNTLQQQEWLDLWRHLESEHHKWFSTHDARTLTLVDLERLHADCGCES